jgi:hypothetical protein
MRHRIAEIVLGETLVDTSGVDSVSMSLRGDGLRRHRRRHDNHLAIPVRKQWSEKGLVRAIMVTTSHAP